MDKKRRAVPGRSEDVKTDSEHAGGQQMRRRSRRLELARAGNRWRNGGGRGRCGGRRHRCSHDLVAHGGGDGGDRSGGPTCLGRSSRRRVGGPRRWGGRHHPLDRRPGARDNSCRHSVTEGVRRPVDPREDADAEEEDQYGGDGHNQGPPPSWPTAAVDRFRRRTRLPLLEERPELAVGVEVGPLVAQLRRAVPALGAHPHRCGRRAGQNFHLVDDRHPPARP